MRSPVRSRLEHFIGNYVEMIPEGDTYAPQSGNLQTISNKDEERLAVNRNVFSESKGPNWSVRITLLGNFAVSPPEIETVNFIHEIEESVVDDFERPFSELELLQLGKIVAHLRPAANRLQHMQSSSQ